MNIKIILLILLIPVQIKAFYLFHLQKNMKDSKVAFRAL